MVRFLRHHECSDGFAGLQTAVVIRVQAPDVFHYVFNIALR